ncbi:MAG: hypothetical protein WC900_01905 [Oscillospiraceae bacterium]|jgi:hypothetical protein
MADEAAIINNPDSTPGAVSTGYQLQNTNMVAGRVGMDATVVTGGTGQCVLEISGPVDVNGVLYSIGSAVTFTLTVAGTYYIHLAGSGNNLTPTIGTGANTFDPDKNARYTDTGSYRVLNWVVYFDGVTAEAVRLLTPENGENESTFNELNIETANITNINYTESTKVFAYLSSNQNINVTSPIKISFNAEYFDIQSEFDTSTNIFTAKKAGYYIINAAISIIPYAALPYPNDDNKFAYLYINGNKYPNASANMGFIHSKGGGRINFSIIVYLDINDTVEIYTESQTDYATYTIESVNTFLNISSIL